MTELLENNKAVLKEFPTKVELHVHLDGAMRHSTIWDLAKKKNIPTPGNGSYEDLCKSLVVSDPKNLHHFLKPYEFYSPLYQGDVETIERVAYEYCEDAFHQGIVYAEVRYSPHKSAGIPLYNQLGEKALEAVVEAVIRGFKKGYDKFGINVKTLLTIFYGWTGSENVSEEVLRLCQKYDDVVGFDVCTKQPSDGVTEEAPVDEKLTKTFEEARKTGIHTTIHAGEASGPTAIKRAKDHYRCDRIGHGYHVIQDPTLYAQCLKDNIHFECCPYSSLLTGAVPGNVKKHPIVQFVEDNANISLNSDDPTLTGKWLYDDYILAKSWGLTNQQIYQANLNAAKVSFLPEQEKNKLVKVIKDAYKFE
ncbi:adenosine deaminase-like isoform X1 [Lycorma delicatula]|uniref:adenosine deaminase-like isoform X1 n=1 Tax=Lycorma delicatula TaxID=130591 RepID=UPI003F515F44